MPPSVFFGRSPTILNDRKDGVKKRAPYAPPVRRVPQSFARFVRTVHRHSKEAMQVASRENMSCGREERVMDKV
jgi:hypothetical protein